MCLQTYCLVLNVSELYISGINTLFFTLGDEKFLVAFKDNAVSSSSHSSLITINVQEMTKAKPLLCTGFLF